MTRKVNQSGVRKARSLIRSGKVVEQDVDWSFTASDGNKLLGEDNDDFKRFGSMHLAINTDEDENTKARFSFPFGKDVNGELRVFRSGLIAARQRAGQVDADDVFRAAGRLLDMIDDGNEEQEMGQQNFTTPTMDDAKSALGASADEALLNEWLEVARRTYQGCIENGGSVEACSAMARRAASVDVKPGVKLRTDDKERKMGQSLSNVEIFRTGTWNGDEFTSADLDDIVSNFNKAGFKPPVKLGHKENSGDPAFGWVAAIRRIGDRLVADFTDLPEQVFNAIKNRQFDAVSSEIFFNLKRGGKLFKRALKAVALLGAEIPAVSDLKPLSDSLKESLGTFTCDQVILYTTREDDSMSDKEKQALEAKIAELEQKLSNSDKGSDAVLKLQEMQETIKQLQQETAEAKERERKASIKAKVDECRIPVLRNHLIALYDAATQTTKTVKFSVDGNESELEATKVLDDMVRVLNKTSEKLFKELGTAGGMKRDDQPMDDPGAELDKLTREYMSKNSEVSYTKAFTQVLNNPDNAELKTAYARRAQ